MTESTIWRGIGRRLALLRVGSICRLSYDACKNYVVSGSSRETAAFRFEVFGRVQGVGFRYFVHAEATGIGVMGWVRNRADGSVEVWAEGSEAQLDRLRLALARGPRISRVDRVAEHPVAATGYDAFRITG